MTLAVMRYGSCLHGKRETVAVTYAIFDTPAIHPVPGIEKLTQAGSETVPPTTAAISPRLSGIMPWRRGGRQAGAG